MLERIKNREDITSLISRSPTLNSDLDKRAQSSNLRRKNVAPSPLASNFGNKNRSKFLKTFAHGFSSPSSDSIMSNKNNTVTNKVILILLLLIFDFSLGQELVII